MAVRKDNIYGGDGKDTVNGDGGDDSIDAVTAPTSCSVALTIG